jgi:BirA family biotin operon repressor/biotin-[acetyl-CoA-carboxylase] ligase
LYLSVIFRPASGAVRDDRITPLLTLMAGVAAAQGVRAATGLAPGLKWPNDLVIEPPGERSGFSRFRKLAGILAEAAATGGELQSVVVGIGINLTSAAYPPDVEARATSIEGELGRPVERAAVLVEVLSALASWRRALIDGGQRELLDTWRALAPSSRGRRVRWMAAADRVIGGITQGIDDEGALLVKTDAGVERIIAGDVQWEE